MHPPCLQSFVTHLLVLYYLTDCQHHSLGRIYQHLPTDCKEPPQTTIPSFTEGPSTQQFVIQGTIPMQINKPYICIYATTIFQNLTLIYKKVLFFIL